MVTGTSDRITSPATATRRVSHRHRLTLAMLSLGAALLGGGFTRPCSGGTLVLDETGYYRTYLLFERDRVDGELLREKGTEMLGARGLSRLQRSMERRPEGHQAPAETAQEADADEAEDAWMDRVQARYMDRSFWLTLQDFPIVPMAAPPADWAAVDFDDQAWPRRRMPLQIGRNTANLSPWQATVNVRAGYSRSRFHIEDPQRDGPYTLTLSYRGGVRVLVNGIEVARGHLPAGDLAGDTLAEAYPLEAYIRMASDFTPDEIEANTQRNNGTFNVYDQAVVRDVTVPYAEASEEMRENDGYHGIAETVWNRLYDARTRTLGPIEIPADVLRAGANVLAIEFRRPPVHPVVLIDDNSAWFPHAQVSQLALRAGSDGATTALAPPSGVQVWAQDPLARVFARDFLEAGGDAGEVRIVAARNGTFSGQVVVRSDRALDGLAVTVSDLSHADGAGAIPADAIRVQALLPTSVGALQSFQDHRNRGRWEAHRNLMENRYGEGGRSMATYQQVTDEVPAQVEADTPQPIHLSLRTPADAAPGRYRGTVRVAAEGITPVEVPITVELSDWVVPDPGRFQTAVLFYQDPTINRFQNSGVSRWSDQYLSIVASSLRHLARMGADWVQIPVIENHARHPITPLIRWVRGTDGALRFEFDQLDRYLDLVLASGMQPKVINFHIQWDWHNAGLNSAAQVLVHDEATGETERINIGPPQNLTADQKERWHIVPRADEQVRRDMWRQFAHATHTHMKNRGLAEVMHFGTGGDREADPALPRLMQEFLPDVPWARWSHMQLPDHAYRAVSVIYPPNAVSENHHVSQWGRLDDLHPIPGLLSGLGWNDPNYMVANSRNGSSVHQLAGSHPMQRFRIWPERALIAGYSGIGYVSPEGRGGLYNTVGVGIEQMFFEGPDGFHSSTQGEALIEGLQEGEARIFIEQAIQRELLPPDLTAQAIATLNRHFVETGYLSSGGGDFSYGIFDHAQAWQERSRRLYALAGDVARAIGMRPREAALTLRAATGEIRATTLNLESWTSDPLNWSIQASANWMQTRQSSGTLTQSEALPVALDLRQAEPGQVLAGQLTLTDHTNNRSFELPVRVNVKRPLELEGTGRVAYLRPGEPRTFPMVIVNHSNQPHDWEADPSQPWLALTPSSGHLEPGHRESVQVTMAPPQTEAARIEAQVRLGPDAAVPLLLYVEPVDITPPEGEALLLVNADELVYSHHTLSNPTRYLRMDRVPRTGNDIRAVPYVGYKNIKNEHDEIIYDIAGRNFKAFATAVELMPARNPNRRGPARFQIITDGQVRFDSGTIEPDSGPIPVVIRNLAEVEKLTLLFTRVDADDEDDGFWRQARFYE